VGRFGRIWSGNSRAMLGTRGPEARRGFKASKRGGPGKRGTISSGLLEKLGRAWRSLSTLSCVDGKRAIPEELGGEYRKPKPTI